MDRMEHVASRIIIPCACHWKLVAVAALMGEEKPTVLASLN